MRKLIVQKIDQDGTECYIGKIDPRELIRVARHVEVGEVQSDQRPLSEKKVKDIAKYVNTTQQKILPNTITIASEGHKFKVQKYPGVDGLYYIDFPSTDAEFEKYSGLIDVMDGQHRLYSFDEKYVKLSDNVTYELGFTWYMDPTLFRRQQIFVACNEKQEKVNANLLMWFRQQLHMLDDEEMKYRSLVTKLNENMPLKGRIVMSAEKIKYGYKAKEVMEALKNAEIMQLSTNNGILDEEQQLKVLKVYLTAWEEVCQFSFTESTAAQAGPAIKSAGLRYMLLLLKPVWDRSLITKNKFNDEFVQKTLKGLIQSYNCEYRKFFTLEAHKGWFSDRTAIKRSADEAKAIITALGTEEFNPLD